MINLLNGARALLKDIGSSEIALHGKTVSEEAQSTLETYKGLACCMEHL